MVSDGVEKSLHAFVLVTHVDGIAKPVALAVVHDVLDIAATLAYPGDQVVALGDRHDRVVGPVEHEKRPADMSGAVPR